LPLVFAAAALATPVQAQFPSPEEGVRAVYALYEPTDSGEEKILSLRTRRSCVIVRQLDTRPGGSKENWGPGPHHQQF
jgi:hypothetical protein